ncbi:MAG: hypothetical protein WCT19_01630 [Candidatus Paceibacterota bacterium]|jgi:hypothetical protein
MSKLFRGTNEEVAGLQVQVESLRAQLAEKDESLKAILEARNKANRELSALKFAVHCGGEIPAVCTFFGGKCGMRQAKEIVDNRV